MTGCNKIRYHSRGQATKMRRSIGDRTLRPYKCRFCNFWHLGHLPYVIRRGLFSRSEIYGGDDEAA